MTTRQNNRRADAHVADDSAPREARDTATLPASPAARPRVVIVGAGFGGISAAKALANRDVDVLLLSRTSYHGFWMMLYQVAAAQIEPDAIAFPVRAMLRNERNVRFQVADVRGVDLERRLVLTEAGAIDYDYLILAAGSATNYFGNQQFGAHTLSIHDVDDAERLRDRVLLALERAAREPDPERRAALLTIAVIGGGPTGVELAGAFAELLGRTLRKEYPALDASARRVVLIDAGSQILAGFSEGLRRSAARKLERLGVELRLGTTVADVGERRVSFRDGSALEAETIVWAAGVRAAPLAETLGVALGRAARVRVAPELNVPGHPEVFVVGDMAYLEDERGQPYPMVAQTALQMGRRAGRNIMALAHGRAPLAFHYVDIGQMAIVGHGAALFDSHGVRFGGALGWLMWLGLHLLKLPGIRNRLAVLADWLRALLTAEPSPHAGEHQTELREQGQPLQLAAAPAARAK